MAGDQQRGREGAAVVPWRHRARRLRRSPLAGPAAVLALLLAVLALPPVSSAFSGRTVSPASLAADQLLKPSDLKATLSCSPTSSVRKGGPPTSLTPLVLRPPAETRPGDLLLAQVAYYGPATVQPPGLWKLLLQNTSGTVVTSAVYYKFAAAGEPDVTFTRPNSSNGDLVGGIVAYAGVDQNTPFVNFQGATGTGGTATTPTLTTTTAASTVLVHFFAKTGTAALSAPSGQTTPLWGLSSDSEAVAAGYETFTGPGQTGSRSSTVTGGASSEWIGQAVLLRPAPTVQLAWIQSPSTWATGYQLERSVGGTIQATQTINGVSAAFASDGVPASGTTYSYQLRAYLGSWRSPPATVDIDPTPC
jgi:hypothetical protein